MAARGESRTHTHRASNTPDQKKVTMLSPQHLQTKTGR
jgi:hypothetical protein